MYIEFNDAVSESDHVVVDGRMINPLTPELFFFNFSTPCIQNLNNTGTKQVSIMKQTAFWREKTESIEHV